MMENKKFISIKNFKKVILKNQEHTAELAQALRKLAVWKNAQKHLDFLLNLKNADAFKNSPCSKESRTALAYATQYARIENIKILRLAGCIPFILDRENKSCFMIAKDIQDETKRKLVIRALKSGINSESDIMKMAGGSEMENQWNAFKKNLENIGGSITINCLQDV